jgi:hypothetical protein
LLTYGNPCHHERGESPRDHIIIVKNMGTFRTIEDNEAGPLAYPLAANASWACPVFACILLG